MDNHPVVTLKIKDRGDVKIELYPETAPNTAANFISLVQKGFYNGLIFHRVIPGRWIQGGCPQGTGTGGPGYHIKGEFDGNRFPNALKHDRGVLSMARAASPDSAGSQFFIMHQKSPHLDGQYAAFGKVIAGIDIVDAIANVPRNAGDRPHKNEVIEKAVVETFGVNYPAPQKT